MKSVLIIFICILVYAQNIFANQKLMTLQLQHIHLQDALLLLAKELHRNMVLVDHKDTWVTLNFKQVTPENALQSLLLANQLTQWKFNQIWYIGTHDSRSKYKENLSQESNFLDHANVHSQIWQMQYVKVQELLPLFDQNKYSLLSEKGIVKMDARSNILYIRDTLPRLLEVKRILKKIDIPLRQIQIQAYLTSIDDECEKALGIQFSLLETDGFKITKWSGTTLHAKLIALEKSGHADIISNPSLFTANLTSATIESGEEIPYQETTDSGGTSVAFKKAVLSLKVTPQIMPGDEVLLQLQVNQDKPSKRVVLGVPAISTRQITTNVVVKDGQTAVLGGIYELSQEWDRQGLPFLNKLPLVGWLFRQQNVAHKKRELLIFITPKIMI